jgi:hypothetical protein
MTERLRRTADMTLDFESLKDGDTLYLDGEKVSFAGENNGNVWVKWKRKSLFIRKTDLAITRLRLEP